MEDIIIYIFIGATMAICLGSLVYYLYYKYIANKKVDEDKSNDSKGI